MDWSGGAGRAAVPTDASRWNEEETEFLAAEMKEWVAKRKAAQEKG